MRIVAIQVVRPSRWQGMTIRPDLAGTTWGPIRHEGFDVHVRFPSVNETLLGEPTPYRGTIGSDPANPLARILCAFAVRAAFEDPLKPTDVAAAQQVREGSTPATRRYNNAQAQVDAAFSLGLEVSTRVLDWVRVRQPWVGPFREYPDRLSGRVEDAETGSRLDFSVRPPMTLSNVTIIGNEDKAPSALDMESITRAVEGGEPPDLGDVLLAEAQHAAFWLIPPDTKRSVLFATSAYEIRAKSTLRRVADENHRPLIISLFPEKEPARLEIASLVSQAAKAVAGRSLKEEDPSLETRLRALVAARNRLAHRGVVPSDTESRDGVQAAMLVFDWLASLPDVH